MKLKKYYLIGSSLLAASLAVMAWAADEEKTTEESLYGALYYAANLTAAEDNGFNKESVIMYYPGETGFIAATTNQPESGAPGQAEWWISDTLGITWELSDDNPLEEYGCTQVGRHSVETYNDVVYFGASCTAPGETVASAMLFKLTGKNSVELIYTHASGETPTSVGENPPPPPGDDQPGEAVDSQFPTAAVVNNKLYMFYNGGFVEYDGTTIVDTTTASGQPEGGVPLEASSEIDGKIYLAFTTGEVMEFDGTTYTIIGDNYLEEGEVFGGNLPSIEVFNGTVYVGNQSTAVGDEEQPEPLATEGAKLFKYDPEDDNDNGKTWEVVTTLGSDDTIINKMQVGFVDGSNYLTFYSANGNTGTNIYAVDNLDNITSLVNSGLGGLDPANNSEVVSIMTRRVEDAETKKTVMIFGTQNQTDQTKIFVLNIDEDLPVEPSSEATIVSAPEEVVTAILAKTKYTTAFGEPFKLQVSNKVITKGDRLTLYVNDEMVDKVLVKDVKNTVLKWKGASKKKVGSTFTVSVGRRPAYGSDKQLSSNTVTGESMKVKVVK